MFFIGTPDARWIRMLLLAALSLLRYLAVVSTTQRAKARAVAVT